MWRAFHLIFKSGEKVAVPNAWHCSVRAAERWFWRLRKTHLLGSQLHQMQPNSGSAQAPFRELTVQETQVGQTLPRGLKGAPAQPCADLGGKILAWDSGSHSQSLGRYLATLKTLQTPSPPTPTPTLNSLQILSANKIITGPPQRAMLREKCSTANLYQLRCL